MKKFLVSIFSLFLFFGLISCAPEEDSVSTSENTKADIVGESLISIPSALSSSSSGSSATASFQSASQKILSTAPAPEDQPVWEVYEGVRDNIAALEGWTTLIKELTRVVYTIVGTSSSGSWDNNSTDPSDPSRITWGSGSAQGYDYIMELFYGTGYTKGFEAFLTVNESTRTAKGVFTWYFSVVPEADNTNPNAQFQFIFDSTVEPKIMEVKVTGLIGGTSEPEKAHIKVTQSSDHVINLWGNYYFPNLDMFEDSTTDTAGPRNYVFAATGYDETGQNISNKNKGILQLALPVSSEPTITNIWTNDSVSAIFLDRIREVWAAETTSGAIAGWTGLPIDNNPANFSDSNVISVLDWAKANGGHPELDNLIFVLKLVNPAYFDSTGFVGTCLDSDSNGTCEQGHLANVPSGFDSLDYTTVSNDVVSPITVRDMIINFLN